MRRAFLGRSGFTVVEMLIVVGILAIIAVIAIPGLISSRRHSNEASAIASLRLIATVQSQYREADKDGDGFSDYAALDELWDVGLIDEVLASGQKHGYVFRVEPSAVDPDSLWFALATPVVFGGTGDRYFVTNHAGVIFYTSQSVTFNTTDCVIPPGALPVGK